MTDGSEKDKSLVGFYRVNPKTANTRMTIFWNIIVLQGKANQMKDEKTASVPVLALWLAVVFCSCRSPISLVIAQLKCQS